MSITSKPVTTTTKPPDEDQETGLSISEQELDWIKKEVRRLVALVVYYAYIDSELPLPKWIVHYERLYEAKKCEIHRHLRLPKAPGQETGNEFEEEIGAVEGASSSSSSLLSSAENQLQVETDLANQSS